MTAEVHYHSDEHGILRRCYHTCRHWLSPAFFVGWLVAQTGSFGPEHMLWEKIWPFYLFTNWMDTLKTAPYWFSVLVDFGWLVMIASAIVYATKRRITEE